MKMKVKFSGMGRKGEGRRPMGGLCMGSLGRDKALCLGPDEPVVALILVCSLQNTALMSFQGNQSFGALGLPEQCNFTQMCLAFFPYK